MRRLQDNRQDTSHWLFAKRDKICYHFQCILNHLTIKGKLHMKPLKATKDVLSRLDTSTCTLVEDIIALLSERHPDLLTVILYGSVARNEERALDTFHTSDVDLLAVFDSDDSLLDVHQGDILSHTLGLAYDRHLDAPREVQVMFASRTLAEWDPTFIANVKRDGIILYARGTLPAPLAA
jgi:predicted nucleotidyltransferase